eukprot:7852226-Pyramimonas_sp.AAC.2
MEHCPGISGLGPLSSSSSSYPESTWSSRFTVTTVLPVLRTDLKGRDSRSLPVVVSTGIFVAYMKHTSASAKICVSWRKSARENEQGLAIGSVGQP